MKTKEFNLLFKLTLFLMLVCGLATCNISKKATSSNTQFKIPKKIIKAEDLPSQVREKEQPVYYVQLFPDEVVQENTKSEPPKQATAEIVKTESTPPVVSETIKSEPTKETVILSNETKEIDKQVEEVVRSLVQNKTKPMYYHIVSGSFQNKDNADRFAGYLKSIGYGNTYVRFFDNGFNRVIVQRYTNEVEARQYLQGYRADNPKFADAWLFYNKDYDEGPLAFAAR